MGSWALVTGASSGIGEAFADVLAKNGIHVILAARDQKELQATADRLSSNYGINTMVVASDLSNDHGIQTLVSAINRKHIQVDYLINSAGFGDYSEFVEADWTRLQAMVQLNITALTKLTHYFGAAMVKQGNGYIVNISSVAGFFPGPRMATYYATKAYVLQMSEAIDVELRPKGVRVMALCPGPTASKFADSAHVSGGLFSGNLPSAEEVAYYGYRSMLRGKTVAIHGLRNKLMVMAIRFLPRALVARVVAKAQR